MSGTAADWQEGDALLVHSSDLHVDDDLGISADNGLVGLRSVLATARAQQADMVLLAGDNVRQSPRLGRHARSRGRDVANGGPAGGPVARQPRCVLPECLFRRAGLIGLPDIHVLGLTHDESILFPAQDLEIWGHAHASFADTAPLLGPRPRRSRWQVAMAHGHYVPPEDTARDAYRAWKITDADLAATGANYIALGHWDCPVQAGGSQAPAYYSGSPDLAGTINLVRLSPRDGVHVRRAPLVWA